jgi:ABC-type multidrug transport system ATPase subunit
MTAAVRTAGLTKRFGRVTAVDDVDMEVNDGDLYGFLGPNGSGKTTTIRMLLGLVYPTSGSIEVLGHPMPSKTNLVLPQVGALVEGPAFSPHLSGRVNLSLLDAAGPDGSRRTRRRRVDEALERVGLTEVRNRRVKAYSSGMKQRLGIASALVRPHRLLVLDEPTNGLDPHGTHAVRDLLVELVANGTTILLSSHLLAEIEMICNRAAIVYNGKLIAQDTIDRLLAPTGRVWVETPDVEKANAAVRALAGVHITDLESSRLGLQMNGLRPEVLNARLVEAGVRVRELVAERSSLEQVFLRLTDRAEDVRG